MAIRRILRKIEDERLTVTATFERIGYKPGYMGSASQMTILLVNVKDKKGKKLTDHLWLNYTKGFQELDLSMGDKVEFDARVVTYAKGKKADKTDYKLSHPTKMKKLKKEQKVILRKRPLKLTRDKGRRRYYEIP